MSLRRRRRRRRRPSPAGVFNNIYIRLLVVYDTHNIQTSTYVHV